MREKRKKEMELPVMPYFTNNITETVCVITDKVYSNCQQRECFPKIEQMLPNGATFKSIRFRPGFIAEGTLEVAPLRNKPGFNRVRFVLRIPIEITCEDEKTIEGFLPDILKDIIIFIPEARDEFDFRIVVETCSQILTEPLQRDSILILSVGVFIVIKVVGRVQLLIPAYGFCPEPPECEEFGSNRKICNHFDKKPFPRFYPPQFNDIDPEC